MGGGWGAVSNLRTGRGVLEAVLYPGESPIDPGSLIEAIEIKYAPLPLTLGGWNVHWLVFFFLVSIGSGLIAGRLLGVEI